MRRAVLRVIVLLKGTDGRPLHSLDHVVKHFSVFKVRMDLLVLDGCLREPVKQNGNNGI
jgi:hypothetical protein